MTNVESAAVAGDNYNLRNVLLGVSVPKAHEVAVVLAVIPNVAAWATGQIDNVLNAAGTSATTLGNNALAQAGVVYDGLKSLGGGAILAGMVLGAIAAFMIDKRYYWGQLHDIVLEIAALCGEAELTRTGR